MIVMILESTEKKLVSMPVCVLHSSLGNDLATVMEVVKCFFSVVLGSMCFTFSRAGRDLEGGHTKKAEN